jgi:23S rRNA U2552 (ribose-2'-O)-methylase RlmE/FtsJ
MYYKIRGERVVEDCNEIFHAEFILFDGSKFCRILVKNSTKVTSTGYTSNWQSSSIDGCNLSITLALTGIQSNTRFRLTEVQGYGTLLYYSYAYALFTCVSQVTNLGCLPKSCSSTTTTTRTTSTSWLNSTITWRSRATSTLSSIYLLFLTLRPRWVEKRKFI